MRCVLQLESFLACVIVVFPSKEYKPNYEYIE